jgi:hypothetical protein
MMTAKNSQKVAPMQSLTPLAMPMIQKLVTTNDLHLLCGQVIYKENSCM